jgi:hypothetical protein
VDLSRQPRRVGEAQVKVAYCAGTIQHNCSRYCQDPSLLNQLRIIGCGEPQYSDTLPKIAL